MSTRSVHTWLLTALILFSAGAAGLQVRAEDHKEVSRSSISLPVGSVFEIIPDHELRSPTYSWTFTQDSTFLQASRDRSFRARLVKEGGYKLVADIRDEDSGKHERLELNITVRGRIPEDDNLPTSANMLVVQTRPTFDKKQRVIIQPSDVLVQLVPNPNNSDPLVLDTDANADTNGDGKTENDQAVRGSFFSTKSTPLYIWFTEPISKKVLAVSSEVNPRRIQRISVMTYREAALEDVEDVPEIEAGEIAVTSFGAGKIGFGLKETPSSADAYVLMWDFGNGKQSMLDRPVHTYARSGTFNVRVRILNLRTGVMDREHTAVIAVDASDLPVYQHSSVASQGTSIESSSAASVEEKSSSSAKSDSDPEPPIEDPLNPEEDDEGSFLGTIITILIITVVSVIVGFVGMYVLTFLRKKLSIKDAMEKMESKLSKPVGGSTSDINSPPPLVIADDTEDQTKEPKKEEKVTPEVIDAPQVSQQPVEPEAAAAPSWLAQGMEKAKEVGQTPDSPPPPNLQSTSVNPFAQPADALTEPSLPASSPQDAPVNPNEEAVVNSNESVPSWLDNSPTSGSKPSAAQEPAPATPPPPPATPATPPPPPPPAAATDAAPAWLAQGMEKAKEEGQTPDSPPPAELADASKEEPVKEEPVKEKPAQSTQPAGGNDMPDWLKAGMGGAETKTETPPADSPAPEPKAAAQEPVPATPPPPPAAPAGPPPPPLPPAPAADTAPAWLAQGMGKTKEEGQTPNSPPPAELADAPKEEPVKEEPVKEKPAKSTEPAGGNDMPDWLKAGMGGAETKTETPPADSTAPVPATPPPAAAPAADGAPAWLAQGMEQAKVEGQTQNSPPPAELKDTPKEQPEASAPTPPSAGKAADTISDQPTKKKEWSQMTPDEKQKERKKQKRKRYRQNKRERVRTDDGTSQPAAQSDEPAMQNSPEEAPPTEEKPTEDAVKFVVSADSINDPQTGNPPPTDAPADNA